MRAVRGLTSGTHGTGTDKSLGVGLHSGPAKMSLMEEEGTKSYIFPRIRIRRCSCMRPIVL